MYENFVIIKMAPKISLEEKDCSAHGVGIWCEVGIRFKLYTKMNFTLRPEYERQNYEVGFSTSILLLI